MMCVKSGLVGGRDARALDSISRLALGTWRLGHVDGLRRSGTGKVAEDAVPREAPDPDMLNGGGSASYSPAFRRLSKMGSESRLQDA